MSREISRRKFLKIAGVGAAAALASTSLKASASPKMSQRWVPHSILRQNVIQISYWQAPIWRYGADNQTVLGDGSDEWIKDAISRFERLNPEIKVNLELIPWDQWNQKVTTAWANGESPNVLYGGLSPERVMAGIFDPLDDYITSADASNWLPGLQDSLSMIGRTWGIPIFLDPGGLMAISKTVLEANGLGDFLNRIGPKRDGLTFDLITEMGKAFTDGSNRFLYGVGTDHATIAYWGFGCWLNGFGVRTWSEDEQRFIAHENEMAVKALQWYLDAQDQNVIVPNQPKYSDVESLFWNQRIAMRLHWRGILTKLEVAKKAGQAPEDMEIILASFPHLPEVGPFKISGRPPHFTIGRTNNPAQREASFRFANWLASDPSNGPGWLVNGFLPATLSAIDSVKEHPLSQEPNTKWLLEEYLPKFKPGFPGENFHPLTNVRTARIFNALPAYDYFMQQMQSLLLKQKTPAQMLEEVAGRINSALGQPV